MLQLHDYRICYTKTTTSGLVNMINEWDTCQTNLIFRTVLLQVKAAEKSSVHCPVDLTKHTPMRKTFELKKLVNITFSTTTARSGPWTSCRNELDVWSYSMVWQIKSASQNNSILDTTIRSTLIMSRMFCLMMNSAVDHLLCFAVQILWFKVLVISLIVISNEKLTQNCFTWIILAKYCLDKMLVQNFVYWNFKSFIY